MLFVVVAREDTLLYIRKRDLTCLESFAKMERLLLFRERGVVLGSQSEGCDRQSGKKTIFLKLFWRLNNYLFHC